MQRVQIWQNLEACEVVMKFTIELKSLRKKRETLLKRKQIINERRGIIDQSNAVRISLYDRLLVVDERIDILDSIIKRLDELQDS